jgi:hypothetical protein
MMKKRHVHFVGFRDDRFNAAVKVFGKPDFVHFVWDRRCHDEFDPDAGDFFVFADGDETQDFKFTFNDSAFR